MYGVQTYLVKISCAIIYQLAFVAFLLAGIDCECGTVCGTKATELSRMLIGRSAVLFVIYMMNFLLLWGASNRFAGEMEDVVMYALSSAAHLPITVNGRLRLKVAIDSKYLVVN